MTTSSTDDQQLREFVAAYPDDLADALHGHHGLRAERDALATWARRLYSERRYYRDACHELGAYIGRLNEDLTDARRRAREALNAEGQTT